MLVFGFVEYTTTEFHSSLSEPKVNADIDFFEVIVDPLTAGGWTAALIWQRKSF